MAHERKIPPEIEHEIRRVCQKWEEYYRKAFSELFDALAGEPEVVAVDRERLRLLVRIPEDPRETPEKARVARAIRPWEIEDWTRGIARLDGRRMRIGRLLRNLADEGKITPRQLAALLRDFATDPHRSVRTDVLGVVSFHPRETLTISTGRRWTSCASLATPQGVAVMEPNLRNLEITLWLVEPDDGIELRDPLSRQRMLVTRTGGAFVAQPLERVYGVRTPLVDRFVRWFSDAVGRASTRVRAQLPSEPPEKSIAVLLGGWNRGDQILGATSAGALSPREAAERLLAMNAPLSYRDRFLRSLGADLDDPSSLPRVLHRHPWLPDWLDRLPEGADTTVEQALAMLAGRDIRWATPTALVLYLLARRDPRPPCDLVAEAARGDFVPSTLSLSPHDRRVWADIVGDAALRCPEVYANVSSWAVSPFVENILRYMSPDLAARVARKLLDDGNYPFGLPEIPAYLEAVARRSDPVITAWRTGIAPPGSVGTVSWIAELASLLRSDRFIDDPLGHDPWTTLDPEAVRTITRRVAAALRRSGHDDILHELLRRARELVADRRDAAPRIRARAEAILSGLRAGSKP